MILRLQYLSIRQKSDSIRHTVSGDVNSRLVEQLTFIGFLLKVYIICT